MSPTSQEPAPLLFLHGFGGRGDDFRHAGRDDLVGERRLIAPDLSSAAKKWMHRSHAERVLALIDREGIPSVQAIGVSMGGNTLLHMATMQPERIEAMVIVSATTHFPELARALQRQTPGAEFLAEDYEDLAFTIADLQKITARTLIVYGDSDPLYPVEIGVSLYRGIPNAQLLIVPGGGHCPIFAPHERAAFVDATRRLFATVDARGATR